MDKELFILTKEELEERDRKVIAKCAEQVEHAFKTHNTWQAIAMDVNLHTEPVPLPSPVKVLKAIEISHDPSEQGMYERFDCAPSTANRQPFKECPKCGAIMEEQYF